MPVTQAEDKKLKTALKEAFAETLHEQRALLHEIFAEVLEDFALTEAIREGRKPRERREPKCWRRSGASHEDCLL